MNSYSFISEIQNLGIDFFCGVPDSLLKEFCLILETNSLINNVITANEGSAIAIGAGHYLSSGNPACVYLQNSGLGNTINPLLSLMSKEVYNIPLLLVIGWRGEPGIIDEPQHTLQGKLTREILDTLGICVYEISNLTTEPELKSIFMEISEKLKLSQRVSILVRKNSFDKEYISVDSEINSELSRYDAIELILNNIPISSPVISTTGKASRELYEICQNENLNIDRAFLTVGSMGHASMIALGVAKNKKNATVYCLDGDGALTMHMGALTTIGKIKPKNFVHILLDNKSHESVGGMSTSNPETKYEIIAQACGYPNVATASTKKDLVNFLKSTSNLEGPYFLKISVKNISRDDLKRPSESPEMNKQKFMESLR